MDTSLLNVGEQFSTTHVYNNEDSTLRCYEEWTRSMRLNGSVPNLSRFDEPFDFRPDYTNQRNIFNTMLTFTSYCTDTPDPNNHDAELYLSSYDTRAAVGDVNLPFESFESLEFNSYLNEPTLSEPTLPDLILELSLPETGPAEPTQPPEFIIPKKQIKAAVKKLDKKGCKYIIADEKEKVDTSDDIDVETVIEGTDLPVLEASNPLSLLVQFEASESPSLGYQSGRLNDSFEFNNLINLEISQTDLPDVSVPDGPINMFPDDGMGIEYVDYNETSNTKFLTSVRVETSMDDIMEVLEIESETSDMKPEIVDIQSDVVATGPELIQLQPEMVKQPGVLSSKPPVTLAKPRVVASPNPQVGSSKSSVRSSKSNVRSSKPQPMSSKPKLRSSKPQPISLKSKVGSLTPQVISSISNVRSPRPQVISPEPQVIPPRPQVISPKSQMRSPKLQVISTKPQVVSSKPQVVSSKPQVVSSKPQVVSSKMQVISTKPQTISPKPQVVPPKPQVMSAKPQTISPKPQVIPPKPQVISRKAQVIPPKPQGISPKSQVLSSKPQVTSSKRQGSEASPPQNYPKSKQILDALPQELIARINESGKRKPITVIPPIPNRKRTAARSVDTASQHRNKVAKTPKEPAHIDHDYCASGTPYPKEPCKDSGFQSEDDDRSVIRNQPTVKTADGKIMVSLLKANTIRNNAQKKKLNLEEYKKRKCISSNATSQSNSPVSSTCSSPLPEDNSLRFLRYQEKLMKMGAEVLKTQAKCSKSDSPGPVATTSNAKSPKLPQKSPKAVPVPVEIAPPPDLEVKTSVSIGTMTDFSTIISSKIIRASAQQLEDIKPLLQKNSDKINSNSFITAVIENMPKVNTQIGTYVKAENQELIREDLIIEYLEKDRVPVKTANACTQTDFDKPNKVESDKVESDKVESDKVESRYRRRIDERSTSSSSSGTSKRSKRRSRRRAASCSSKSSSNSSSNSSSSSSSKESPASDSSRSCSSRSPTSSRTNSPRPRHYGLDRMSKEEKRRVVYVGSIPRSTTTEDLTERFEPFGKIEHIQIFLRKFRDHYAFVTFYNSEDAYKAKDHGNDNADLKYDLGLGGRRQFCTTTYSDLDNMREDTCASHQPADKDTYEALLLETWGVILEKKRGETRKS